MVNNRSIETIHPSMRAVRRPVRIAACIAALGIALLAAGCRDASRAAGGEGHGNIENIHWQLVELSGRPPITDSTAGNAYVTFTPADSNAGGNSGCNRFSSHYVRSGDLLAITRIISTKMACLAPEAMDREAAFFNALQATASWKRRGDTLELFDSSGMTLARFIAVQE